MTPAQIKVFLNCALMECQVRSPHQFNDDLPPSQREPTIDGEKLVGHIRTLLQVMAAGETQ